MSDLEIEAGADGTGLAFLPIGTMPERPVAGV